MKQILTFITIICVFCACKKETVVNQKWEVWYATDTVRNDNLNAGEFCHGHTVKYDNETYTQKPAWLSIMYVVWLPFKDLGNGYTQRNYKMYIKPSYE